MSVRSRLTLFFVVIVVLPLLGVSLLVRTSFERSLVQRTGDVLAADQRAALGALATHTAEAAELAQLVAGDEAMHAALARGDTARLAALAAQYARSGLTVAVTGTDGRVLAQSGPPPRFRPGVPVPSLEQLLAAPPDDPWRALFVHRFAAVETRGAGCRPACRSGYVWVGFWADRHELDRIGASAGGTRFSFLVDGRLVATTHPEAITEPHPSPRQGEIDLGSGLEHARRAAWSRGLTIDQASLLVSVPVTATAGPARQLGILLTVLALFVLVVVTLLGALLTRTVGEPLRDLAEQARRIARGEFDRVPPHTDSSGEVGELARAFDAMRTELDVSMRTLRASRDQLTWAMTRVGDTLASTSELPRLLGVVLEAAVQARQARAGSLLLFTPDQATLVPEATYRLEPDEAGPVASGTGIAGRVAASGDAVVLPAPDLLGSPLPAAGEPVAVTQVSVPLRVRGTVLGVLSLYDRAGGPFTAEDAEALAPFAGQAAVGIENMRLHEEARYLSMTDDMTGTWNYRYFRIRFEQEIERARRFQRELSLLVLDLDRFKQTNDTYGHQRGDEILRELVRRVDASIRDADTFARYGGEEFILILPETDPAGAMAAAEKLRGAVGGQSFPGRAGMPAITVTMSVGVACFPEHATTSAGLIDAADAAMYRAKAAGRNQVKLAAPALGEPAVGGEGGGRGCV